MITSIIHRLITILLFSIITAQLAYTQTSPWSVQAQLNADPGGTISFRKIDAPQGDTMNIMALGFGGANIVVCRTTNGGATWDQPLQRWAMEFAMHDLSHPAPNVAVIVGDSMFRDTGSTIFYTHNSGDSWHQGWCDSCKLPDGSRYQLRYVSMCDSLNGILGAFLSCLARTTDGGATWHRITDPTNGQELFYGVQCLTPSTYILTTYVFGTGTVCKTYKTTDSGMTWTSSPLPANTFKTDFLNPLQGWATSSERPLPVDSALTYRVFRTTDGGTTWDTVYKAHAQSTHDDDVSAISMADATHGMISTYGGGWLYTTDGRTWQEGGNLDSIFHVSNLTSIVYVHPDRAWTTDVLGHILSYDPRTAAVPIVGGDTPSASISVFPNPITTSSPVSITVTIPRSNRARLSLVDTRGATIMSFEQPDMEPGTYRLTWLPPAEISIGAYFLYLVADTSTATCPITIMH